MDRLTLQHGILLRRIDEEVKNAIKEQFNINDLDLSDNDSDIAADIFNHDYDTEYYELQQKIQKTGKVTKNDVKFLRDKTAVIKPKNRKNLLSITKWYSIYYNDEPLNWLDVSDITDMSYLFSGSISRPATRYIGGILKWSGSNMYNGDISKWDVSNVTDMSYMFSYSQFNQNISGWDVSNVKDMSGMFEYSKFNQDISNWDTSNVLFNFKIFTDCNIYEEYMPKFRKNCS